MKLIALSKTGKNKGKYFAQVDDADFDWLNQYNWCAHKEESGWYAVGKVDGKLVRMHRFILGITDPDILVDHTDHNGLNCQRNNIRSATHTQNCTNRTAYGSSKYLGVSLSTDKKAWQSNITIDGKIQYLGRFKSEEEAARRYDKKAVELHGEFANLNFK